MRSTSGRTIAGALLGLIVAIGCVGGAPAQPEYPAGLITMIVPFAAGGPTDIVARILSQSMSARLGQQIVVENVVGAGGTTAATRAMRSPADGYTIVMGNMGTHAAAVALYPNLPYNPATDFEPIGMTAGMPVAVVARKDFPARNLVEFARYLKDNGPAVRMAHAGVGSISYTTCLLFNSIVGAKPSFAGFQGTAPATRALVAGRVDYLCDQIAAEVPQINAGAVRAYAVGSATRNPALPTVPTAEEAGLAAFNVSPWNALFAPKGTPDAVIRRLNAALSDALDDASTRAQLLELGSEIPDRKARTPEALAALVRAETARWIPVIRWATAQEKEKD
ncbi:MAG TPA: tripartite tricarboxylate transporter substrate-binding protein [Xanthobacteraceae bacterium]